MDYVNKKTSEGVHYSRYIASWVNAGGYDKYGFEEEFILWLQGLHLTSDEINDIRFMATNGRLELERSVSDFLRR